MNEFKPPVLLRDQMRADLIEAYLARDIPLADAEESMELNRRQCRRLVKRYREAGPEGLITVPVKDRSALRCSSYRYRSAAADDSALRLRIKEITESRVHYGYSRVHVLLKLELWCDNHKRIQLLKTDNGSEFAGKMLEKWVCECHSRIDFSRPGTPTDKPR